MRTDLSLQQAPPFSVPARFLVSAPLFGLFAALVLLYHGPDMINHRWTPELLAVTHFLTLGFLAMSMMGAMMQLMPVLMGMVIPRSVLFSSIIHTPLVIGTISLGLAWLFQINQLFMVAILLLGFSFTVFISMTAQCLLRSKNTHVTRSMMLLALLALLFTVGLGLFLAINYLWPIYPLARLLTNLHLSLGLFGWVFLLLMSVAYQVIPMFQITDEYPALHQRWMGWSVFIGLIGLSLSYIWSQVWLLDKINTLSYMLLASCLLIFAISTLRLLHKRRRLLADVTMRFWQVAMSSLILVTLSWIIPTLMNWNVPVLLLGILMIHGFAMSAINGMMYKIIPFIIWLHLSTHNKKLRDKGARDTQLKVPHMRKIISETTALWQFRCHLISLILLAMATIWPLWFYYPAALMFAVAQFFLLFNLLKATRFYNIKTTEFSAITQTAS